MRRRARLLALAVLAVAAPRAAHARVPVTTLIVGGTPVHPVEYGHVVSSALTTADVLLQDGSRAELWMFDGAADGRVTIVTWPEAFDIYLVLRHGAPFGEVVAEDDNSAGARNASIEIRLPRAGACYPNVTSAGRGAALGPDMLDLDRCP